MRYLTLVILLGGSAFGQALIENAAAAAGGSAGGVAGKKLSDGLSTIFNKVDKQTAKAAQTGRSDAAKNAPLIEAGPGVPKADPDAVPEAPPLKDRRAAVRRPAAVLVPEHIEAPAEILPPPPQVTAEDLNRVTAGMNRDELLKMGAPASKITMFDDGHLVEIYQYAAKDATFGVVRLSDGSVSSVEKR